MKVDLNSFARSGIEARVGADIPAGVQAALFHYTRRLKSGRAPVGMPRFARDVALPNAEGTLELFVDPETQAALEAEARRQGTTLGQVALHAVMVYLSDLDSTALPAPTALDSGAFWTQREF